MVPIVADFIKIVSQYWSHNKLVHVCLIGAKVTLKCFRLNNSDIFFLSERHQHIHPNSKKFTLQLLWECECGEGCEHWGAAASLSCSGTGKDTKTHCSVVLMMLMCITVLTRRFFCIFYVRVTEQRETGEWECQEKTWQVFTLPKTLLAGTTGCQAVKRYALNYVKSLSDKSRCLFSFYFRPCLYLQISVSVYYHFNQAESGPELWNSSHSGARQRGLGCSKNPAGSHWHFKGGKHTALVF